MNDAAPPEFSAPLTPPEWRQMLLPYSKADTASAVLQLVATAVPFAVVTTLLLWALAEGWWPALALAVPAGLLVVRLFIIQHDCGHGSYLRSVRANDLLGRALAVLTMMPYAAWRRDHAAHHATCGNLGRRGIGDVTLLTVAEYRALPALRRLAYRLYRNPVVLFLIGPAWLLFVRYRLPIAPDWRTRLSILETDLAGCLVLGGLMLLLGPLTAILAWTLILLTASSVGVWLFYVQHQFESTYWQPAECWDFHRAALDGSSFYDLPRPLDWLTGSIGFHHIHHLGSRIPSYRLRRCHAENLALRQAKRLTLGSSIRTVRLALWDEARQKLVSFGEARQQVSAGPDPHVSTTGTP